jgi:adenylyl cyclase-associated protein
MDDRVVPVIPKDALTALARRLEAATSRLEDMASATIEAPKINGTAIQSAAPTATLPPAPVAAPATIVAEPLPESVEDFDTFITGPLKKFVNLSDELGGPVAEQVGA